jgi:hypothetical protein
MPRPHFPPGKDPVPNLQEAGWASGSVWTGAENLAPTGIRSPDRPARRQSLYRLRFPALLLQFLIGILLKNDYFEIMHEITTIFNFTCPLHAGYTDQK